MMTEYTSKIDRLQADWVGVSPRTDRHAVVLAGFTGSNHALGSGVT
jgi:hypothetical protein